MSRAQRQTVADLLASSLRRIVRKWRKAELEGPDIADGARILAFYASMKKHAMVGNPLACPEHGDPWGTIYPDGAVEYDCGCAAEARENGGAT